MLVGLFTYKIYPLHQYPPALAILHLTQVRLLDEAGEAQGSQWCLAHYYFLLGQWLAGGLGWSWLARCELVRIGTSRNRLSLGGGWRRRVAGGLGEYCAEQRAGCK